MTDPAIPTTWHDTTSARAGWSGAPADDLTLTTLLEVAKIQVLAYAGSGAESTGTLTEDPDNPGFLEIVGGPSDVLEAVPVNYRHAQLMQARNLWNASKANPSSGDIGGDTFALSPRPLDWTVKALIRPQTRVPVIV
jgi:hypothetical protein